MRLFVAGYPPAEALDHLATAVDALRLGEHIRTVPRARWHFTVAFLGEVSDERVPAVGAALRAGVARWRADGGTAPALRLAGGGRFGRGRSTVLWVGLTGDLDGLRSLGARMRHALRRERVPYDRKPLRPHLTIARPGTRVPAGDLAADLATLAGYGGPGWTLDAVHLVRSRLGPDPTHETLATVPLPPT